jgi:hypothetical protein
MMIRSQNIECDIYTQTAKPVHFVQGEKGREVMFTFVNSAIPIEDEPQPILLSGLTATIHILKPDGNFIIDNMTISGNAALYTLGENACAAGGAGVYDVSLSKGSDVVYTAHGAYVGDFRAISDDVVNSVSEAYGVTFPEGFQEKLVAGENITIIDNVISATGGGDPTTINATATVDATTGTPSVTVTKTTSQGVITFNFAFSHLKGETGAQGPAGADGADGAQGPAGPGVAAGGTAGQILTKVDSTDYNTKWADPSTGGFTIETIYTNPGTSADNITLASGVKFSDYDFILFDVAENSALYYTMPTMFSKQMILDAIQNGGKMCVGYLLSNYHIYYDATSDSMLTLGSDTINMHVRKVYGIKF